MKLKRQLTGVLGLAVNGQREYLITQRNEPEHPAVHLKWQVPGGGVEFGEQPEETLVREMKEELNLEPTIIYPYPMVKNQVWHHSDIETSVILVCYLVTIGHQVPCIGDPETLDYKWVNREELYRFEILPLTEVFIDGAEQMCNHYSLLPA